MEQKINVDALVEETLDMIRSHGLHPQGLGLILNVPRDEFDALALQYPGHHPGIIILKNKNEWFVQIQPILLPGDYPDGSMLRPTSFG